MLATPTEHLPVGDAWVHEVKWDGVRILLESGPDGARLFSRNGNVVTPAWPDVALAYERDVLLDGEIIALNERGVPDFRVLQHRMHVRKATEVA